MPKGALSFPTSEVAHSIPPGERVILFSHPLAQLLVIPGRWLHFQLSTCKATQPVVTKIMFLKQDDVSRKKRSLQGKLTLASNLQLIFFLPVPCAGKDRECSIVIGGYPPHDAHGHCRSSLKPGQVPSCSMIYSKCNPKGCHCAILLLPTGKLDKPFHRGCFKHLLDSDS